MFLAGTLGPGWFMVPETLQNADCVFTTRGTAPPSSAAFGPNTGATSGVSSELGGALAEGLPGGRQRPQQQQSGQQAAHLLLADLDPESVPAAIQRLFNTSVVLDDSAFHDFVGALCKLSLEMISMQSGTDVGTSTGTVGEGTLGAEDDTIPSMTTSATSLVTPRTELFSKRTCSGKTT